MTGTVPSGSHHELVIIAGELQGRRHLLVRERPVSVEVIEIVFAFLEKNAKRLGIGLPNQGRIDMASPDVREAPDVTDDLSKGIGPLPRGGEGTDPTRTVSADDTMIRVAGQGVGLADFRKDLFEEKPGILVAERVIFEAAILSRLAALFRRRNHPGIDEDSDRDGDVASVNQVIENGRGTKGSILPNKASPILTNQHRRGFSFLILGGDIDPVIANRARKDLTGPGMLGDFPLWNALPGLSIRTGAVVFVSGPEGSCCKKTGQENRNTNHERIVRVKVSPDSDNSRFEKITGAGSMPEGQAERIRKGGPEMGSATKRRDPSMAKRAGDMITEGSHHSVPEWGRDDRRAMRIDDRGHDWMKLAMNRRADIELDRGWRPWSQTPCLDLALAEKQGQRPEQLSGEGLLFLEIGSALSIRGFRSVSGLRIGDRRLLYPRSWLGIRVGVGRH